MSEEEAINRLAACKDLAELIEANLQQGNTSPMEGASNEQTDHLEQLLEVDPAMFSKARARKKAGVTAEQIDLLFDQRDFIERQKVIKNLMGNRE